MPKLTRDPQRKAGDQKLFVAQKLLLDSCSGKMKGAKRGAIIPPVLRTDCSPQVQLDLSLGGLGKAVKIAFTYEIGR